MQIPWLTRPPTAEEVAAHAKAYPILGNDGVWLYVPPRHAILGPRRPQLRLLHATAGAVWTTGGSAEEEQDARWLPCAAEGIPVYSALARRAGLANVMDALADSAAQASDAELMEEAMGAHAEGKVRSLLLSAVKSHRSGLHEDIRAAAKEAKASVAAAAETGAEWAIEKLPRDVAGLVDVLLRDSAFLDALECRGIDVRRRHVQPRKYT